jgi:hypothetical protein
MRSRALLLMLALAAVCRAEIIDRIAVTVGRRVITQSDIVMEIRLSAFMNQSEPDFGPASRKKTAERLVERALLENEMEAGNYPAPTPAEVQTQLDTFKKERFPTEDAYPKALARYGIREEDLKRYLSEQLAVLRFIDARFGPGVQILDADVRDYYDEHFVKEWENKSGTPVPSLDEVRSRIEDILREEQVDRLMNNWLKEARERTRIDYKPEAFR